MQCVFVLLILCNIGTLGYRTSMCLRKNEQFSLCGWRCPPTCININMLPTGNIRCPMVWECRVGCRCSAGFLRDEYSKDCVLVGDCPVVVTSAPLKEGEAPAVSVPDQQEYYRDKRSQYQQYATPCAAAAAASAPMPAIAPGYVSPYQYPHTYGYVPHYRSLEEQEILGFSDMDHMPVARYAVMPSAPHPSYPVAVTQAPATTGPVFSVFPSGGSGGCGVPLLFSCSPSVVQGHVVQTQPHYYPADTYRGVEGLHHESHEEHSAEELSPHEHLTTIHEHSSAHAVHQ